MFMLDEVERAAKGSAWRVNVETVCGYVASFTNSSQLAEEGSNLQPPDPKSGVLPVELSAK